jgi:hypothetical protein
VWLVPLAILYIAQAIIILVCARYTKHYENEPTPAPKPAKRGGSDYLTTTH